MKLNSFEINEIKDYLNIKRTPSISNQIFQKIKSFQLINDILNYKQKIIIPSDKINETLQKLLKLSLFGRDKTYLTLKLNYTGFTRNDISNFLNNLQTYQLHKKTKVNKIHTPIISSFPLERIQIDLIDLNNIRDKDDDGDYRYVLTCIDHFSKYSWCYPLVNKNDKSVVIALKKMIDENKTNKNKIKIIQSDNGSEFINNLVRKLCIDNDILQIFSSPYTPNSNGAIERFNKTLKNILFKSFTELKKIDFPSILQTVVTNYNNTYHMTTKKTPHQMLHSIDSIEIKEVKQNIIDKSEKLVEKDKLFLKKSDYVRVSLHTESEYKRNAFFKMYNVNFSKDIFKIKSVSRGVVRKYRIVDSNGIIINKIYYYDDLQKIDPKKIIFPKFGDTMVKSRKKLDF